MEEKVRRLMEKMERRHRHMRQMWYGSFLPPVLIIIGFALLVVGIVILPTPAPGWLLIFMALGILSLVHPPTRRLNIWLAANLDAFYIWYRHQNLATKASLMALLTVFVAAVMGTVYYFLAPNQWPLTNS